MFEVKEIAKTLKCRTCDYEWLQTPEITRKEGVIVNVVYKNPKTCPEPGCKTKYWNTPYTRKPKTK